MAHHAVCWKPWNMLCPSCDTLDNGFLRILHIAIEGAVGPVQGLRQLGLPCVHANTMAVKEKRVVSPSSARLSRSSNLSFVFYRGLRGCLEMNVTSYCVQHVAAISAVAGIAPCTCDADASARASVCTTHHGERLCTQALAALADVQNGICPAAWPAFLRGCTLPLSKVQRSPWLWLSLSL